MLCAEIFIALKNKLESPSTWAAISGISEWNTQFPGMEDYQVLGLEDSASVTPEELNDWEPKLERFWSYLKACPCNPSEEPLEEVPGLLSGLPLEGLSESLSEPPPRSLWATPGNPVISSPILKAQMSEQMSEMSLKAPPKIEEWPLDIPTTVMITGQPPPESSSSAPNPVVTNCGKELDLLLDSKPSPFERCSPRYHLSQSPDWYRRDITPRNPLYYLTPFPVQSSSTAPIPQWQGCDNSTPVSGVSYEPIVLSSIYGAKIESRSVGVVATVATKQRQPPRQSTESTKDRNQLPI